MGSQILNIECREFTYTQTHMEGNKLQEKKQLEFRVDTMYDIKCPIVDNKKKCPSQK
jgi:hypothetical protein